MYICFLIPTVMAELKKILLVDDNPEDTELTTIALTGKNLAGRLVIANDGVEALEYLRYKGKWAGRKKENPAFILLDIKMPRMNGLELLEIIRQDPALAMIPAVMLTSSREEQDLRQCYQLGANAYVVKPVDFKEFISTVGQLGQFWATVNEVPSDDKPIRH